MTQAASARRHAVAHELTVTAVEPLTDDAVALTLDVPPELREEYRFVAGQHVSLRAPDLDDVRRSYSICTPATSDVLKVAVKRLPDGAFSGYVFDRLRPGDRLEVMTPTGRFNTPLDPEQAKHYAAFAAGSGITPIVSLVWTTLETEPRSRCTVVYGNRTTASIMFLEELEDLKDRFPDRLAVHYVLSREPQDAELLSGRLDRDRVERFLATLLPPDGVDEWFLCGPMEMVEEIRGTLLAQGVEAGHVHRELFHAQPRALPAPQPAADAASSGTPVTIVLDGRRSQLAVSPSERVLDAALRVRADAPYACRNGVCGTCRARVMEGSVEMEQCFALEDDEVAAGIVLACQAHPTSDHVVLDFDV